MLHRASGLIGRRPHLIDVLLAGTIVLVALLPTLLGRPLLVAFVAPEPLAMVVGFLAVTLRRSPFGTIIATVLLTGVEVFHGDRLSPLAAVYVVVLFSLAVHGTKTIRTLSGIAAVLGGFLASWSLSYGGGRFAAAVAGDSSIQVPAALAPPAVLLVAWSLGMIVRLRRTNETETALRMGAERRAVHASYAARIDRGRAAMARDVHDVVGHSLAVIVAQSDSGQFTREPAELHRILGNISATARTSLHEVREVLAGLDTEPAVRGADVWAPLVARLRETGRVVHHEVRGSRGAFTPLVRTAAERILREATTNVLKHGDPAAPVRIVETWWPDEVVIEVENHIAGILEHSGGRGLANMRHRAHEVGGAFEAGVSEDRFTTRLRLPTTADEGTGAPR